ncbi:MAG: carboxypeptidase regulatory-like domain-containing protein [Phycisphaerae bacterium]|nr:carboxypeptidase regulatory-like domain-containing protein [Phycisphaerae bacterium]
MASTRSFPVVLHFSLFPRTSHMSLCQSPWVWRLVLVLWLSVIASGDTLPFPFQEDFDDCVFGPVWEQAGGSNPVICSDGELTARDDYPAASAHLKAVLSPTNSTAISFGFCGKAQGNGQDDESDYAAMFLGKGYLQNYYCLMYGLPTGNLQTVRVCFTHSNTVILVEKAVPWDGAYHNVEASRDEGGHWVITYDGDVVGEADDGSLTQFDFVDLGMNNKGAYITEVWGGTGGSAPTMVSPRVSTLPPIVTSTSVTFRGRLEDDGGGTCQYRFRCYLKRLGPKVSVYTPWQYGAKEGAVFSSTIDLTAWTGTLIPDAEVCCVAEARNAAGSDAGDPECFRVPAPSRKGTIIGSVIGVDAQGRALGSVAGATVDLQWASGPGPWTATTDAQGQFAFSDLEPGKYTATAKKVYFYDNSEAVDLASGETKQVEIRLTRQSDGPSATDFTSPDGKHFIEGMPGDLRFGVTVAWNGTPGSVRFQVAGEWHDTTITDLGGSKARASLTIPAPSAVLACSEVTVEVTNGEGETTYMNAGVRFSPIPGIVVPWYRDNIPWTPSGLKLTYVHERGLHWQLPIPTDVLQLEAFLGFQGGLSYDLLAGIFVGSLGGFGGYSLDLDIPGSKWELLGEGRLDGMGTLSISFAGCDSPRITPGWSVSCTGKAGVGLPAIVILDVVVPGLGSALSYLPVIGDLKVRLYVVLGGTISGEYEGGRTGDCFLGTTSLKGALTAGAEAHAVLDLKITGAGVYVGGTGTPEFQICPDFAFEALTLRAYVGVYAWAPLFSFREEYGAELRFEAGGKTKMAGMSELPRSIARRLSVSGHMDDVLWAQEDDLPWSPMDASYLRWGEANRVAEKRGLGGIRILSADDPTVSAEDIIAENVTNLAAPTVLSNPAQTVVLFALHDPNKPWYAATDIGVATKVPDGEWALDRIADDDAAEFGPEIIGTEPALVAWTRISGDISGTTSPDEVTPHLEIVTARLDQNTGLWTVPEQLTFNSVVDRDPLPVVLGPTQGILWIQNQGQASIGDANNGDRLLFARWDGAAWQAPETLWSGPKGIMDFAFVADSAGEGHVVLTVDEDGDLDTTADSELYAMATVNGVWQEALRLTEDDVEDSSPALLTPKGVPMCVWDANGTATYSRLDPWNPRVVYNEATDANDCMALAGVTLPVGGAIAYTTQGPNGVDIVASFYDADLDLWSQPRQLTHDEHAESALSLTCDGNDLVLAYLKTQTVREDMDVEINGQMTHIENVPQPGRVDLCMLRHTPARDAAVVAGSVAVEPGNPSPGQTATITATIENAGDLPLQDVQVAFYDGDPNSGDTLIGDVQVLSGILIAGGKQDVLTSWTVPSGEQSHRVFVVVDPYGTVSDRDPENNRVSKLTVLPDLTVETCWSSDFSPREALLTARVTNTGAILSGPFQVSWRLNTPDGNEIGSSEVQMLVAGGACEVSTIWDLSYDLDPNEGGQVFVVLDSPGSVLESDEGNNSAACAVFAPAGRPAFMPVAHWQFDDTPGMTAEDSAGTNDGTIDGTIHAPTYVDGKIGGALQFDGKNDYVNCGNADVLAPEKMTLALWAFLPSTPSSKGYLIGKAQGMMALRDYTLACTADGRVEFYFTDSTIKTVTVGTAAAIPSGRWVHIAAVRDGSKALLYIDGVPAGSQDYSFTPTNKQQPLTLGALNPSSSTAFFKGTLDDVRLYDVALSESEVLSLYQQDAGN